MSAIPDDVIDDGAQPGDELAADLRELQSMASLDPGAQPLPGEPEAAPRATLDQEIAGALMLIAGVIKPFLPTVAKIYSEETCAAVGAAVAPVCEKHGWLSGGVGGEYGEELMCLVVVGPMAYATYVAASGDLARLKEKGQDKDERNGKVKPVAVGEAQPEPKPGALRVPGSDTVSFGVPLAAAA